MSAANESPAATPSLRRLPFTVRLSPSFVNPLLALPASERFPVANVHGLLFGLNDNTSVHVLKTQPFTIDLEQARDKPDYANEKKEFERAFEAAHKNLELKDRSLVGWYAMRESGGLLQSDIEFHNRHFPRPGDLAIIVRSNLPNEIICELYSRSIDGALTEENHRWGALRQAREATLEESTEVTMRTQMRDDFFLRAYQQSYEPETGAKPSLLKRVFSRSPKALEQHPESNLPDLPRLAAATQRSNELVRAGDPPPVISIPMAPARSGALLWVMALVLFGLAAAGTFTFVRNRLASNNVKTLTNSSSPLGLKLEGQNNRILVTWNRNSDAAKSATGGRLVIDDSDRHQTINLEADQIANGSVLYTPSSADVTFRLEFLNQSGKILDESLRLLDSSTNAASRGGRKLSPPAR